MAPVTVIKNANISINAKCCARFVTETEGRPASHCRGVSRACGQLCTFQCDILCRAMEEALSPNPAGREKAVKLCLSACVVRGGSKVMVRPVLATAFLGENADKG